MTKQFTQLQRQTEEENRRVIGRQEQAAERHPWLEEVSLEVSFGSLKPLAVFRWLALLPACLWRRELSASSSWGHAHFLALCLSAMMGPYPFRIMSQMNPFFLKWPGNGILSQRPKETDGISDPRETAPLSPQWKCSSLGTRKSVFTRCWSCESLVMSFLASRTVRNKIIFFSLFSQSIIIVYI